VPNIHEPWIPFAKYSGAGNDFILIDDRDPLFPLDSPTLVSALCHRREGIGADGVILLQSPTISNADLRMRIFNADGSEAEMCGNGIRCIARFAQHLGISPPHLQVQTFENLLPVTLERDLVTVGMGTLFRLSPPFSLKVAGLPVQIHSLNTGVPHAVITVEELEDININDHGAYLCRHPYFAPQGTNVTYMQVVSKNQIKVRTYERGVNGETLACGTGATAAAIIASRFEMLQPPIEVTMRSGDTLLINFTLEKESVISPTMSGPADLLFEGKFPLHSYLAQEKHCNRTKVEPLPL
jgi:diaminopimelate epimerase